VFLQAAEAYQRNSDTANALVLFISFCRTPHEQDISGLHYSFSRCSLYKMFWVFSEVNTQKECFGFISCPLAAEQT